MTQLDDEVVSSIELNCNLPESISTLEDINGLKIIILVACIPRYDKIQFLEELDKKLEKLYRHKIPIALAGDFNINTLKFNNLQQAYLDTVNEKTGRNPKLSRIAAKSVDGSNVSESSSMSDI